MEMFRGGLHRTVTSSLGTEWPRMKMPCNRIRGRLTICYRELKAAKVNLLTKPTSMSRFYCPVKRQAHELIREKVCMHKLLRQQRRKVLLMQQSGLDMRGLMSRVIM